VWFDRFTKLYPLEAFEQHFIGKGKGHSIFVYVPIVGCWLEQIKLILKYRLQEVSKVLTLDETHSPLKGVKMVKYEE
jgi:hypothetical protein